MGPSSPGCRRPQPTASRRFPLPASSRCEDLCVVWRSDLREMARQRADAMVDRLAELVSCESPSGVLHALERCADLLIAWGDDAVGRPAERVERDGMPHLLWRAPDPTVLVLGHFDTVWPLGTVADWPMTVRDGVASGPGVFDMKAGIVQGLAAFELAHQVLALEALSAPADGTTLTPTVLAAGTTANTVPEVVRDLGQCCHRRL